MIDCPTPSPNLLPQTRIASRLRHATLSRWSFAIVSVVILGVAPSIMMGVHLRTAKSPDQTHLTRSVSDLRELQTTLPPLKKRIAQLEEIERSQECAKTRVQWTSMLGFIDSLIIPGVRIHTLTANIQSETESQSIQVSIGFHSESLSQAREFLVVIESSGLFDELKMPDSRRISQETDSLVNSMIHAQILASEPGGKGEKTP